MKRLRPSGQFYVEDVGLEGLTGLEVKEIPVDNFFWMTNRGEKIRLEMSAGKVYVVTGIRRHKIEEAHDVPDALRIMADILSRRAHNKQ